MRKALVATALGVALMVTPAVAGTMGGTGDDIIHGTRGDDVLTGGPGNDTIYAGLGKDVVIGGPGQDVCFVGWRDVTKGCEVVA